MAITDGLVNTEVDSIVSTILAGLEVVTQLRRMFEQGDVGRTCGDRIGLAPNVPVLRHFAQV